MEKKRYSFSHFPGEAKKKNLSAEDIEIVRNLLDTVRPHQIYAAGDLSVRLTVQRHRA